MNGFIIFSEIVEIFKLFILNPLSVRQSKYLEVLWGHYAWFPQLFPLLFWVFQVCFNLWNLKGLLKTGNQGQESEVQSQV